MLTLGVPTNTDEALLAYPQLTLCCAAGFLTGHALGLGTPAVEGGPHGNKCPEDKGQGKEDHVWPGLSFGS